jgi:D-aminopeptidase
MVRARDLGIPFIGTPGPFNAITDVRGVEVGQVTLISGEGPLVTGRGPIRTGVSVILPRGKHYDPVFAAWHSMNGAGEMTGTHWIEESGFLESGIALTNTTSVGDVHKSMISWAVQNMSEEIVNIRDMFWFLPVVAETTDYFLNDAAGFHIQPEHVYSALNEATTGTVAEGNVGGGTGMICHDFKGGIGTSSRQVSIEGTKYTLGVLLQTNYGERKTLTIAGVPVGEEIIDLMPESRQGTDKSYPKGPAGSSIIVVAATDAPLLPGQLKRIARRVSLGISKVGGVGNNSSGDIFLAFSTANPKAAQISGLSKVEFLPNALLGELFEATIQATEEAIVNALIAATTMTGINGNTVYALPHDRLIAALKKFNRYVDPL